MTGADILIRILQALGTRTIFGVPGDTNVPFYAALQRHSETIDHVMCRDERSAGYMADAYARLTNRIGVLEVPSGAGAMYALPTVAEANESSVAMLLMTIDIPLAAEGRGMITELDATNLFAPITKASIQVKSADKLPEIVRRAFRIATSGKPGAVHLVIPEDILLQEVSEGLLSFEVTNEASFFPVHRPSPAEAELVQLLELIASSRRPLIVAGGGVNRSGARKALRSFVEASNVPVVSTITGQNSLPDSHRLAIGVIGDNGFHPHAMRAIEEADLIIYLGSRIGSVVSVGWSLPSKRESLKIVQVDIDPEILGNMTQNTLSIAGDVKGVLERLRILFADNSRCPDEWVDSLNIYRAEFWQGTEALLNADTLPLNPEPIVRALQKRLQEPVNILSDAGTPTPYMTRYLRLEHPDSNLIIPRAYGGLGYAIPAVVGAWKAQPLRRPIGLFGDGSFNMSVGELETLVRLKCPAILIQFNNACFGWIKGLHRLQGKASNACYSVDFTRGNAAAVALAFGLKSWEVRTLTELESALDEAFSHDGPCLIDVHVQSLAESVPPVYSWLRKAGENPLELAVSKIDFPSTVRVGLSH